MLSITPFLLYLLAVVYWCAICTLGPRRKTTKGSKQNEHQHNHTRKSAPMKFQPHWINFVFYSQQRIYFHLLFLNFHHSLCGHFCGIVCLEDCRFVFFTSVCVCVCSSVLKLATKPSFHVQQKRKQIESPGEHCKTNSHQDKARIPGLQKVGFEVDYR